jgi:hypothetical protein
MMITENSSFLNMVVNSDSKELLNTNLVKCSCRPFNKWYMIKGDQTTCKQLSCRRLRHGLLLDLLFLWPPYLSRNFYCTLSSLYRYVFKRQKSTVSNHAPDSGEAFNVGRFLEESSPYAWGAIGIGLCTGLSVLGAGWYVPRIAPQCPAADVTEGASL